MFLDGGGDLVGGLGDGSSVQPPEVSPYPFDVASVAGVGVGFVDGIGVPVAGEPAQVSVEAAACHSLRDLHSASVGEFDWLPESCGLSGASGASSPASSDHDGEPDFLGFGLGSPRSVSPSAESPAPVVAVRRSARIKGRVDSSACVDVPLHGCFGRGLGLPVLGGSPGLGPVVLGGEASSHQRQGAVGGVPCHSPRAISGGNGGASVLGQLCGRPLREQAGHGSLVAASEGHGGSSLGSGRQGPNSPSFSHGRFGEFVGGCSVPGLGEVGRLVPHGRVLRASVQVGGHSSSGSLRVSLQSPSSSISDSDGEDSSGRPGCLPGRLERVGLPVPVSSSRGPDHVGGLPSSGVVSGAGPSGCPVLAGSTLVSGSSTSSPSLSSSGGGGSTSRVFGTVPDVLALTRLEFLKKVLAGQDLHPSAVSDLLFAHRPSTCRQYEAGWKKFQRFLSSAKVQRISPQVLLWFASHVFHSDSKPSLATVTNALAAIKDPVKFGFDVVADSRQLELLRASFFIQRPSALRPPPNWSLQKVLDFLQSPRFVVAPSGGDLLLLALFLVAMATGHRVSQLAALCRGPEFARFTVGDSSVTLAPKPKFLAKNERAWHRVRPVSFSAWLVDGGHHALCPVAALRKYIDATSQSECAALWVMPVSLLPLATKDIAGHLVRLIGMADPSSDPKAGHVRKYASSIAFFRSFDVEAVRLAGQWSSSYSFVTRYLVPHLRDVPCVALGSGPSSPSSSPV